MNFGALKNQLIIVECRTFELNSQRAEVVDHPENYGLPLLAKLEFMCGTIVMKKCRVMPSQKASVNL